MQNKTILKQDDKYLLMMSKFQFNLLNQGEDKRNNSRWKRQYLVQNPLHKHCNNLSSQIRVISLDSINHEIILQNFLKIWFFTLIRRHYNHLQSHVDYGDFGILQTFGARGIRVKLKAPDDGRFHENSQLVMNIISLHEVTLWGHKIASQHPLCGSDSSCQSSWHQWTIVMLNSRYDE